MSEVGFYHLTRTGLAEALARLLARTLEAGERALVRGTDAERLAALDTALWAVAGQPWLPHGTAADGDADLQPIWMTIEAGPAANGARFLFLIDGAPGEDAGHFARVFDVFDGGDPAAVTAARTRYAAARMAGHAMTYWRQGASGWEKA